MKKLIKIVSILLLVVTFSCDESDSRFRDDPTSGWVEFKTASTITGQTAESVTVPLVVNVPVYENGLDVSFVLEAVEGDFTQFVTITSGTVTAPATDDTRSLSIELALVNMEAGRDFLTSFDIVLTTTSVGNVNIGVDENSIVKHRINIPCSNPDVLPNDYLVGDYSIEDVAAVIGPGNGTENFETATVNIAVSLSDPNVRTWQSYVLPAFVATPTTINLEFTADDVMSLGDVATGIGCGGGGGAQYIYTNAGANNSSWDICNDESVTVNYTEDPLGSCGGPFQSSFSLTKL